MDHVFWCNLKKYRFRRPGCGNCRAVETVENEPQFSTVSTALGKLGKDSRVSHSSHNLYGWIDCFEEREKNRKRAEQITVDKLLTKA